MSVYLQRSPYFLNQKSQRRASFFHSKPQRRQYSAKMMTHNLKKAGGVVGGFFQEGSAALSSAAQALRDVKGGKRTFEFGARTIMVLLGVVAIFLSLAYLAHFNQVATKGYELRRLEADRQQLLSQYEIKNMRLAESMSLQNIRKSERVSAMRRPGEAVYLRANSELASR